MELESWKKKKIEAEQKLKKIIRNKEKSLILFEQEKEMKRKQYGRLIPLQQLVEYETQEFLRAQAELKHIASKIAALEKEEKKYHNIRVVSVLSILICSIFLVAMITNDNQSYGLLPERIDSSEHASPPPAASPGFFSLLKKYVEKYAGGNDLITGASITVPAVPAVPPIDGCPEITACTDETVTICKNETIQKCDPVCVNETKEVCAEECRPRCNTEEVNGKPREVCISSCSTVCATETVQQCSSTKCYDIIEEKCTLESVEKCAPQTICENAAVNKPATPSLKAKESPEMEQKEQNNDPENKTVLEIKTSEKKEGSLKIAGGLSIAVYGTVSKAGISYYNVDTIENNTYNNDSCSGSPGTLFSGNGDDGMYSATLGFDFPFFNNTKSATTTIYMDTNGRLSWDDTASDFNPSDAEMRAEQNIAVLWQDFGPDAANNEFICTNQGTSPNKFAIFRWDSHWYSTAGQVQLEAKLFENGTIMVRYGNISDHTDADPSIRGVSLGNITTYDYEQNITVLGLNISNKTYLYGFPLVPKIFSF